MMASMKSHAGIWPISTPPWWRAYALGWAPIAAGYLIVLALFIRISGADLVASWASNVIAPFAMGAGVFWVVSQYGAFAAVRLQVLGHLAASVAFTSIWALALFRGLQALKGLSTGDWSFDGFSGAALGWQLFQGLLVYYLIAGWGYAYALRLKLAAGAPSSMSSRKPAQELAEEPAQEPSRESSTAASSENRPVRPRKVFVRTPEGHAPVDHDDVIAICGAPVGVELKTTRERFEVRATLSELEAEFGGFPFVRVHRSTILNANRIRSIEPAGGGRLIVHMEGGATHESSRAGAASLRSQLHLGR
ncbi:MAG: hypothetical protein GC152_01415 [Alphaproteobacteria bacterium]|nr:hypothetical protein [Alphaproteobacteria bacterium]